MDVLEPCLSHFGNENERAGFEDLLFLSLGPLARPQSRFQLATLTSVA